MGPSSDYCPRLFQFERDTFAFANELVWQYHFDPATGAMKNSRTDPPPTYPHRCFVLVRSARQFFNHAWFEPALPQVEPEVYRGIIRQVVSRSPRRICAGWQRIVIPGFDSLRAFSQTHEPLLKAECGGGWQSYFLRSHWRMVFPIWRRQQERMAQQLRQSICRGLAPAVHIFRFPQITINHGIMLFGMEESEQNIQFEVYDPNMPAHPIKLTYDKALQAFGLSSNCYWGGGTVSVIEIYGGWLY